MELGRNAGLEYGLGCTSLANSLKKCQLNIFSQFLFLFFFKKQQINITTQT